MTILTPRSVLRLLGPRLAIVAELAGIMVPVTWAINRFDLDRTVARQFFDASSGWAQLDATWALFLYRYGPWPAIAVAIASVISLLARKYRTWLPRAVAVHFVAVLVVGPGLLVNTVMKQHLARPRPNALIEFGGVAHHVPALDIHWTDGGASFPCGHASMGFMLAAPYFVLRRSRRRAARWFLLVGVFTGLLIGAARVAAGAHFVTDVLWSGVVVFGTCILFSPRADKEPWSELPIVRMRAITGSE